ncbi:MAG: hypothetical protein QG657_2891 [Acidobacteriota bacterium]|nr:hypothetical protein [Acidobacteriota bacterium]
MKIKLFIAVVLLFVVWLQGEPKTQPGSDPVLVKTSTVQLIEIFRIADLKPAPKPAYPVIDSFFDIDGENCYYLIDGGNHRILKYNPKKEFICQIGSIGQGDKDLYHPAAILIDGHSILVADSGGQKIKRFSLSGEFISSFEIKDGIHLNTIEVSDGKIYCDIRFDSLDWNKRKLLSVFATNGKYLVELGKGLDVPDWTSYRFFNSSLFRVRNNYIYGAFKHYPVMFKYTLDGRVIFYNNLGEMNISEITEKNKEVKEQGMDTPQKKISNQQNMVKVKGYCSGFGVDDESHIYYGTLSSSGVSIILHFDAEGKLIERLILEKDNRPIKMMGFFIRKARKYVIGYVEKFADAGLFLL